MSKRQFLCIMGVWIIIFLFLGVPFVWLRVLAVISGLIIIVVSYNLPHEKISSDSKSTIFTENSSFPTNN